MNRTELEKRSFPRIDATIPIHITPEFIGQTLDLSETGLKFILQKPLLLSRAQAKIVLAPGEYINTEFKVIWNKHLIQDGKFTYGACFIRLKEKDLETLRSVLIKNNLNLLLQKVADEKARDLVSAYWNSDFKEYMNKLVRAVKLSEQGEDKEDVCKEVNRFNEAIMQAGDALEIRLNDRILIKKIKKVFREVCGPWVYKAEIVKHAFEKPRGYPGDYKLIEIIYDNKPLSSGIGYCYDKYFLNNAYTEAVRNRKEKMRAILKDSISKKSISSRVKILNLACGSCREIKELITEFRGLKDNILFTLIDRDGEALKFSEAVLKNTDKKISFRFLQHNVLGYINHGVKYLEILGKQDLIYSIGLADYLPDRVLKGLISFCYTLLNPHGELIIAHKDVNKYKPLPPDWWCDWNFYPRDENHLLGLITKSGISNFDIKITREPSNIILFISIKRV